jgi:hypothetical protein
MPCCSSVRIIEQRCPSPSLRNCLIRTTNRRRSPEANVSLQARDGVGSDRAALSGRGLGRYARRAVLAFAECPRRTDSNSKPSSRVQTSPDSEHQFDEMKGTGEIRSRAEPQPNKFSPAPMLFFGPNSAPNSGRIPPRYTLVAPRVRIPPSPPYSPSVFVLSRESLEIRFLLVSGAVGRSVFGADGDAGSGAPLPIFALRLAIGLFVEERNS